MPSVTLRCRLCGDNGVVMTLALQIGFVVGLIAFAYLVFMPYFSVEHRAKRRRAFIDSLKTQVGLWNISFVVRTDSESKLIAVTREDAFDKEISKNLVVPVCPWPILVFTLPGAQEDRSHYGTVDDLYNLYGGMVERLTGFKRSEFTDDEFEVIISGFVRDSLHLFVPGAGTPEQNELYRRRYAGRRRVPVEEFFSVSR